ncbi:MAG: metallophosphoesterase family protein [Planctomycetota bacterium]
MLTALVLIALVTVAAGDESEYAALMERTTRASGTTPMHWRVVWTRDPAHEAVVAWSTAEAGATHEVRWDVEPRSLDEYRQRVPVTRSGRYTASSRESDATLHFHHTRLVDLPPAATIHFQLVSDGVASRPFHFRTADPDAGEVVVLAGGDSRSGLLDRCRMNLLMASLVERRPETLALVHGGDYVYDGNTWRDWERWLSHHELTTGANGRVLPLVPARGNHDVGPLYGQVFDEPGAPNANYWTTKLGHVAFVNLNSETSVAGEQAGWLAGALQAGRATSRWLIANYHRPIFPAVKPPGRAKAHWLPLFDDHKVDLVLESDGHVFKRTVPIYRERHDARGTVYIGEGGLGVAQRKPRLDHWYLEPPGRAASAHHVLRLTAGADALRVETIALGALAVEFEPTELDAVLAPGAVAAYSTGDDPPATWAATGFDDSSWLRGQGGFGFGDDDDVTLLDDMRGHYSRVYLRYSLDADALRAGERLGLAARYDDGFVAYLNGSEVARGGVQSGRGAAAEGIANHEATRWEYFPVADWRQLVVEGPNVLAVEGHNRGVGSSDFSLDVALVRDVPPSAMEREGPWPLDDTTIRPHEERWR